MRYPKIPCLVRDYIGQALYTANIGYFNNKAIRKIISPDAPLQFNSMKNESEYRKALADLYKYNEGSWTTPVELFQPYYASAIGKWGIQNIEPGQGIHFVEIGGGTGTCAVGILDFLMNEYPEVYEHSSYTIVDLSTEMNKLQKSKLDSSGHECFQVVSESGVTMNPRNWEFFKANERDRVHVIALEVLDNMPHDKSLLPFFVLNED
jgi:SAM-dependent MidA family methyltransferase